MINSVSTNHKTKIIMTTQSRFLIDGFEIKDLIIMSKKDQKIMCRRHKNEKFVMWTEDHTTGELLYKSILSID